MFTVIPAIDIINGKVVRLTQGDYNRVEEYTFSPADISKQYESHGATRIHIIDLDGAKSGKICNTDTLREVRAAVNCELEFGGGVRDIETVAQLIDLGIDYVILGSILIKNPELAHRIIRQFPGHIIAGIDAKDEKVATEGWLYNSTMPATDLIEQLNDLPLESIIYTDIAKDGAMLGPNLDQLKTMTAVAKHPIIASGGVRSLEDIQEIRALESLGVSGCIIGKAVLSGSLPLSDIWNA